MPIAETGWRSWIVKRHGSDEWDALSLRGGDAVRVALGRLFEAAVLIKVG